jgi:hypothetical protein
MGRGAEFLLLPLGATAALSLAAVFGAFFNRTAARACAGLALGLGALFLLAVLAGNRWDLGWLLFLLREPSPPMLVLCGSMLLSAIAVWAPLRRPDVARPDGRRTPGRPRWRLLGLAACLTAAGAGYGVAQLIEGHRGEWKTRALLAGDSNVRLRRVQIDYQQRRVVCTDPEVLRYLEGRFRGHEPEPQYLGTTYLLSLAYEGGGARAFVSYWADSGDFNLFLGEPGEGGRGHGIRLPRPRPRGVEELASFLVKQHDDVAGSVLILEAGGSRVERDSSLVAR